MKKFKILAVFLVIFTTTAVFAQDSYFEDEPDNSDDSYYTNDDDSNDSKNESNNNNSNGIPITIGIQIGRSANSYASAYEYTYMGYDETATVSMTTGFFNISMFVDFKYLRLSTKYFASSQDTTLAVKYDNENDLYDEAYAEDVAFKFSHIDFQGLLKFPFSNCCQTAEIWPAIGVAYSKVLTAEDENGNSMDIKDNMNDIWLCFGLGADFKLTDWLIFTLSTQLDYSLTPDLYENETGTPMAMRFSMDIGAGIRF